MRTGKMVYANWKETSSSLLECLEMAFSKAVLCSWPVDELTNGNRTEFFYSQLKYIAHDKETHGFPLEAGLSMAGVRPVEACTYRFPPWHLRYFMHLPILFKQALHQSALMEQWWYTLGHECGYLYQLYQELPVYNRSIACNAFQATGRYKITLFAPSSTVTFLSAANFSHHWFTWHFWTDKVFYQWSVLYQTNQLTVWFPRIFPAGFRFLHTR